jgi:hypothetical protein
MWVRWNHKVSRRLWTNEITRWESGGARLVVTALVLEEASPLSPVVRAVKMELSNPRAADEIYLDEDAID